MAMCCPTFRAVAVTFVRLLALRGSHVRTLHPRKVLTRPESTGVAAAATRGGARGGLGTRVANSCSIRRSCRSYCCATLGNPRADGAGGATSAVANGLPTRLKACDVLGVPLADCGTSRYWRVVPEAFAGKVTHPDV